MLQTHAAGATGPSFSKGNKLKMKLSKGFQHNGQEIANLFLVRDSYSKLQLP